MGTRTNVRILIIPKSALAFFCLMIMISSAFPSLALSQSLYKEQTDQTRRAIIDSISLAIRNHYVIPDVAEDMCESILDKLNSGQYDDITELADFTNQLTDDLREVSKDVHLKVQPIQGNNGESGVADSAEIQQQKLAEWRKANFGFRQIERLDGNIGYIDLSGFYDIQYAAPTAIAAMSFLANSDALIIDLRRNTGGNGNMSKLLSSYFFSEPTHLLDFYNREGEIERQHWTEEYVPGQRLTDIPLYILVSHATLSAAEGFSYALKHLDRAKIIGETTRGGANPMESHDFPGLSISVNVPFVMGKSPITKTNWEVTGIEPDISVPASEALEVARMEALKSLMNTTESEQEKHVLAMIVEEVEAKLNPVVLSEDDLEVYTGIYGQQGMQVTISDGKLNVVGYILVPMGDDKFMVTNGEEQVKFNRSNTGEIVEMVVLFRDGREVSFTRSGD
jgi:hypothetical protein